MSWSGKEIEEDEYASYIIQGEEKGEEEEEDDFPLSDTEKKRLLRLRNDRHKH